VKKLYVSNYIGFDESATKATLYSFDSEEEFREFLELSHDERCQVFNVFDESSNYGVLPGAAYHTYEFVVVGGILTLYDTLALNV
jgi:hypothetical protein